MPVTEQPMMRPWRRTPRYHCGPMRFSCTSSKPAAVNHCSQPEACQIVHIVGPKATGETDNVIIDTCCEIPYWAVSFPALRCGAALMLKEQHPGAAKEIQALQHIIDGCEIDKTC